MCTPDRPCGGQIRLVDVCATHLVYQCIGSSHSHIVGEPPSLEPIPQSLPSDTARTNVQARAAGLCHRCEQPLSERDGWKYHVGCLAVIKEERQRTYNVKRNKTGRTVPPAHRLSHEIAMAGLGRK